jgi:DNA invertase Pin-like site-specific DNA recombinase
VGPLQADTTIPQQTATRQWGHFAPSWRGQLEDLAHISGQIPIGAVVARDTLVVPKLDRLARSVPDARGVKLSLGGQVYDPADPMGKMFFNILATFAEFEVDLLRMRTREGMAVARAKGKLRGKQPKLSGRQQRELARMAAAGEYTIADLAEVFTISRATVYRTLQRSPAADKAR